MTLAPMPVVTEVIRSGATPSLSHRRACPVERGSSLNATVPEDVSLAIAVEVASTGVTDERSVGPREVRDDGEGAVALAEPQHARWSGDCAGRREMAPFHPE